MFPLQQKTQPEQASLPGPPECMLFVPRLPTVPMIQPGLTTWPLAVPAARTQPVLLCQGLCSSRALVC
ncbi:hypothetical protein DPEC_G00254700 [Dallia pectoralis]|uniref:Uncharacterized protein n=1 Tax=Dallia pectoralis TaxID=75939 RepID=A0ACC2FUG6_DALPE|nr:hypothetical protein DPEC_G00254700 [Dallia pectoralis]